MDHTLASTQVIDVTASPPPSRKRRKSAVWEFFLFVVRVMRRAENASGVLRPSVWHLPPPRSENMP